MDINHHYQHIMQELVKGHRALVRFSTDEMESLEKELSRFSEMDVAALEKLLCLVEHSQALNPKFEDQLIRILNSELPDHLIVFALNSARKHIITARFQRGQRLNYDFLETLKNLLKSPSIEIVEWTLRTIEECGNQGVYFLQEFAKIKPPPWKWFDPHQRAVRELVTLLERRWRRFEKS